MSQAPHEKTILPKEELSRQLDRALEQTFPASDPISIGEPTSIDADRPVSRRPAKLDAALVDELAHEVESRHLEKP